MVQELWLTVTVAKFLLSQTFIEKHSHVLAWNLSTGASIHFLNLALLYYMSEARYVLTCLYQNSWARGIEEKFVMFMPILWPYMFVNFMFTLRVWSRDYVSSPPIYVWGVVFTLAYTWGRESCELLLNKFTSRKDIEVTKIFDIK